MGDICEKDLPARAPEPNAPPGQEMKAAPVLVGAVHGK
jgi:hypothetical protein